MPSFAFVHRHFTALLLVLLLGNVLVIRLMSQNKAALNNSHSPQGILSLEVSTSASRQQNIIQTWANTRVPDTPLTALQVAQRQTKIDYLFIFFYTLLFCLLLIKLAPERKRQTWIKAFLLLAVTAGLLDVVENIFMLRAMNGRQVAAWQIWVPAVVKWGTVLLMVATVVVRVLWLLLSKHSVVRQKNISAGNRH